MGEVVLLGYRGVRRSEYDGITCKGKKIDVTQVSNRSSLRVLKLSIILRHFATAILLWISVLLDGFLL